jgi:membrane associated rhomboid family serine protease
VLPLHDNVPTKRFPVVTVAVIAINAAVFVFYELPDLDGAVRHLAFFPCEADGTCRVVGGASWPVTALTAMFMHGGWAHLLGNMLFLWIFGNNVEDTLGRARFVVFYLGAGFAATALQAFVTLHFGDPADARIPNIGASGAIAGILGAYILLYPGAMVITWIAPIFIFPVPAVLYLGFWFLFQAISGTVSFTAPEQGGGVAYFAHIGGFLFGVLTIKLFCAGRPRKDRPRMALR